MKPAGRGTGGRTSAQVSRIDCRAQKSRGTRAYAFVPQSEVPGIINQYGLVPLSAEITRRRWQTVIHLQGHDSLLMSCPPGEVWDVLTFLSQSLARPRRIGGEPLTVPVAFKIGRTWGDMTEFKRPPTRSDVDAAVAKCG